MPKAQTISPEEYPTTLELQESQLSQIKDWKVGGRYRIIVDVEQISIRKGMGMSDDKGLLRASFKVLSAKSAGESKIKDEPKPPEKSERNAKLHSIKEKAGKY